MKLPGIKRILPLILTVLLLPTLLAVPAFADSDPFLNVLDYSGINDTSELYYRLKSGYNHLWFNLPSSGVIKYIDMVVYTDKPMQSASACRIEVANGSPDWASLNIDPLGDGYYRIHGDPGRIYSWPQIWFNIEVAANTDFQVCSLNVSFTEFSTHILPASGTLYNHSDGNTPYFISYNSTDRNGATFLTEHNDSSVTAWSAIFNVDDISRSDVITVCLSVLTANINSVAVTYGNDSVPFTCSPLIDGSDSRNGYYYIVIVIDISSIDTFSDYALTVRVNGQGAVHSNNSFVIDYVWGSVDVGHMDPITYWFYQLHGWLSSGFDRIVAALGGSNDSSQVQDAISSAVGELEQAGAALDAVQRPDIGQVNIDVAGMVPASGIGAVGSLVGIVYGSPVLGPIMTMFFTLALVAFVIFGRG